MRNLVIQYNEINKQKTHSPCEPLYEAAVAAASATDTSRASFNFTNSSATISSYDRTPAKTPTSPHSSRISSPSWRAMAA